MIDEPGVVVIGSGPSGAVAALTLLERGIPVTLLESGSRFDRGLVVRAFGRNLFRKWARNDDQYQYVVSGDPQTLWYHTLKAGGLSNFWTGAVPRFSPGDFHEGARLDERYRWPITYDELASFYDYAERLLGVVGERRAIPQVSATGTLAQERHLPASWQRVATTAETFGQGLFYSPLADGPNWLVRRSGAAFNSFERIVSRLGDFRNFKLHLGAHAQRLIWNGAAGRVDGVEYIDRAGGTLRTIHASAVVVAAGPLASPKLLLQSTSHDFPTGLGNSYGVLGHYLHDHPKDWCVLVLDKPMPRLDQPLYVSRAPYASSAPLMGASLTIGPLAKWDRVLSFLGAETTRFGLVTFATMVPSAENYLALHPERRDQFGMPLADLNIRYGAEVSRTVSETHDRLRAILSDAGIQATLECPLERLVPGSAAHFGGGARMHASPRYGVLDGWNRLHEVPNVAVVDASSFTTGVEKNPTLTAMALSARAADRLARELQSTLPASPKPSYALSAVR